MNNNTKAIARLTETTAPYFEGEQLLRERVAFAREVILNTLRKFPADFHPEELKWVRLWGQAVGFRIKDDKLFFYVPERTTADGVRTMREVQLPLNLLLNDPIAVAQYARKAIRALQAEQKSEKRKAEAKELKDLNEQIAALQKRQKQLETVAEVEAARITRRALANAAARKNAKV